MEIKYADNVTLTVEITDQMVKDYRKCGKLVNKSDSVAPCDSCSNNIDIMDGRHLRHSGGPGRVGKEDQE